MFRTSRTPEHLRAYGTLSVIAKRNSENVHWVETVNQLVLLYILTELGRGSPAKDWCSMFSKALQQDNVALPRMGIQIVL